MKKKENRRKIHRVEVLTGTKKCQPGRAALPGKVKYSHRFTMPVGGSKVDTESRHQSPALPASERLAQGGNRKIKKIYRKKGGKNRL